MFKVVH
jgi:dynein heavy chain, axonemal